MSEKWRDMSAQATLAWADNLRVSMSQRLKDGRDEYGEIFQGDPIEQGFDEVLDLFVYLGVARRQLDALRVENERLKARVAELEATRRASGSLLDDIGHIYGWGYANPFSVRARAIRQALANTSEQEGGHE